MLLGERESASSIAKPGSDAYNVAEAVARCGVGEIESTRPSCRLGAIVFRVSESAPGVLSAASSVRASLVGTCDIDDLVRGSSQRLADLVPGELCTCSIDLDGEPPRRPSTGATRIAPDDLGASPRERGRLQLGRLHTHRDDRSRHVKATVAA